MISKNKGTFFLYRLKWVQVIGNSFLLQGYNKINSNVDVLTEHTALSCWNQVLDFVSRSKNPYPIFLYGCGIIISPFLLILTLLIRSVEWNEFTICGIILSGLGMLIFCRAGYSIFKVYIQ